MGGQDLYCALSLNAMEMWVELLLQSTEGLRVPILQTHTNKRAKKKRSAILDDNLCHD